MRPINQQDELSIVDHLDELRSRVIVVMGFFLVALGACFWQNHFVLEVVNAPLPPGMVPATFAVAEAFMSTLVVSTYAAVILTSPLIIYEVWAFVVPAFSDTEKRVAMPLVLMTPLLFVLGCTFGYFVVLPPAVNFLLGFNSDQFNMLLRASDYYSFFGTTVLAMGLLFEMPLAILIASRMGLVTPDQLRSNRRYAIVVIAVIAMLLPGVDPISMLIEMVPLFILFELSIWLTVWFGKPAVATTPTAEPPPAEPGAAMR